MVDKIMKYIHAKANEMGMAEYTFIVGLTCLFLGVVLGAVFTVLILK